MRTSWQVRASLSAALLAPLLIGLFPGTSPAQRFSDQTAQLAPDLPNAPAAWGDYNNDGFVDLLTSQQVWRNDGGAGFTRVFFLGGGGGYYSIWGDYDKDGDLDTVTGANNGAVLFRNDGTTFTQVALPPLPMTRSNASAWGDFDRDGDIDLYVGGSGDYITDQKDAILRSNYPSQAPLFTKTWQEKGQIKMGRGITGCDFDQDGDLDVYVSNYRLAPNYFWRNNGSGVFTDVLDSYGFAVTTPSCSNCNPVTLVTSHGHTIGSAWGDVDGDGYFDLFEGNFSHRSNNVSFVLVNKPYAFYRNRGPSGGYHFDFKDTCGVSWQESYASPALGDYDNDGDLDLFYSTVYGGDFSRLYRNDGNWHFTDVTSQEGLAGLPPTYEAAWADFDNDGDLDLATAGKIFVNGGPTNRWLKVTLVGENAGDNVIGAQARLIDDYGNWLGSARQIEAGTGEGNQNEMILHFGFGGGALLTYANLEIRWPDGTVSSAYTVPMNQQVVIRKGYGWCGWFDSCRHPPLPGPISLSAASVAQLGDRPSSLQLRPATPNPVRARTTISVGLPTEGHVTLEVFNVSGRLMRRETTLMGAGWKGLTFDGRDDEGRFLPNGVYLYRVSATGESRMNKLVIAR